MIYPWEPFLILAWYEWPGIIEEDEEGVRPYAHRCRFNPFTVEEDAEVLATLTERAGLELP